MCSYCHQKFCAKHQLPEEHGCGDAARAKARQAIKKPSNTSSNSSASSDRKKNELKAQLRNKIGQASQARTGKKDAKTKKKKK